MDHLAKTEFNARLPEGLDIIANYEKRCNGRLSRWRGFSYYCPRSGLQSLQSRLALFLSVL